MEFKKIKKAISITIDEILDDKIKKIIFENKNEKTKTTRSDVINQIINDYFEKKLTK